MSSPVRGVHDEYPEPMRDAARTPLQSAVVLTSLSEAIARWRHVSVSGKAEQIERETAQDRCIAEGLRRADAAQQAAAGVVFERAFDDTWLGGADLRTLGETWAAAQAYATNDPRAADAMRRVEDRLFDLQPGPMARYDNLVAQGVSPDEAMRRVVPLFSPGAGPGEGSPTARPASDRAGYLTTAESNRGEGRELVQAGSPSDGVPRLPVDQETLARLHSVHAYLTHTAASGPADPGWQEQSTAARTAVGREIVRMEILLANRDSSQPSPSTVEAMRQRAQALGLDGEHVREVLADFTHDPRRPENTVQSVDTVPGLDLDAEIAARRVDDELRAAAIDRGTPDAPATLNVDEHQVGVEHSRTHVGRADHDAAIAKAPRTAAQLAGESYPKSASAEVAEARAAQGPAAATPRKRAAPTQRPPAPKVGG